MSAQLAIYSLFCNVYYVHYVQPLFCCIIYSLICSASVVKQGTYAIKNPANKGGAFWTVRMVQPHRTAPFLRSKNSEMEMPAVASQPTRAKVGREGTAGNMQFKGVCF